ncbi:MAG: ABC-type dipeptide/oligopeptide/nickel transport system, permease component [Actinotalea sp.]|jgi:oligopeptide transport system permease protein|nr:ABC-type dipeptide/oligopeptide/nickel transport system, permease component [Actinotalea sp.]
MGRYVLRRLLQMIPVFLGATMLIFLMVYALPGDPIESLFGERAADPAVVAQLREQYNLDEPLWKQYLIYLQGIVTLDFGTTFSGQPVLDSLARAFPVTLKLATVAFVVEIVLGVTIGLVAGLRRGGFFDATTLVSTLVVISIPIFVIGFVLQFLIGVKLGWAKPTVGADAPWSDFLLPGLVLGALSVAYVLRLTRTSVAENLRADFVRTATAKGMPRQRVVTVHLLRNSLIPVVTFLGYDLGALMGGAIVTESIFNVPGVGFTIFRAIQLRESVTVVSFVTVLVLVYLLANLVVDLLYAVLDPRIRYE